MLAANEAVAEALHRAGAGALYRDPRAARPRADRGVRASSWPRSATACPRTLDDGAPRALPAGPAPDRGQAGGEAGLVPAAAHDEARALPRGEPRALRPRDRDVRPLHEPDPPLPGPGGAPRAARAAAGPGRASARRGCASSCPRWGCTSRRWSGAPSEAERELIEWKKVRFMAGKLGEVFSGYVTGRAGVRPVRRARRGLRAGAGARLLDERRLLPLRRAGPPAEGREHGPDVPARATAVEVQVGRVDLERRQIDFALRRRARARRRAAGAPASARAAGRATPRAAAAGRGRPGRPAGPRRGGGRTRRNRQ